MSKAQKFSVDDCISETQMVFRGLLGILEKNPRQFETEEDAYEWITDVDCELEEPMIEDVTDETSWILVFKRQVGRMDLEECARRIYALQQDPGHSQDAQEIALEIFRRVYHNQEPAISPGDLEGYLKLDLERCVVFPQIGDPEFEDVLEYLKVAREYLDEVERRIREGTS